MTSDVGHGAPIRGESNGLPSDTPPGWPAGESGAAGPRDVERGPADAFSRQTAEPPRSAATEPIGEIIETSTTSFVAQACELGQAPAFGSLVKVDCAPREVFGLVYRVRTGGLDPGAQVVMRGRAGVRDEAIFRENPDLRAVLRTDFAALIVGYCETRQLRQYLPPQPPPLHWSVRNCSEHEVSTFAERFDYFRTVLAVHEVPSDELLAANLRLVRRARPLDLEFNLRAGRELARLLNRDYDRLSAILRRLA